MAGQGIDMDLALREACADGLTHAVQIATDLTTARQGRELCSRWNAASDMPEMSYTAGLHPEAADQGGSVPAIVSFIEDHESDGNFLGIGECGLDYFHSTEFAPEQKSILRTFFELAERLGLPVILHLRDSRVYEPGETRSVRDALQILHQFPSVRGVLHCFTYTYEEAAPFIERGWFVSYSGILTFKTATALQSGACRVPLSQLLVETDAPFLSPVPHRGEVNRPGYVRHTLEFLSRLRERECGESSENVISAIYENSLRFLKWKRILQEGLYAR